MDRAVKSSIRITLTFSAFAVVWIVLSDYVVESIFIEPQQFIAAQTYKGIASVLFTSLILFWLILRCNQALIRANDIDNLTGLLSHNTFIHALDNALLHAGRHDKIILGYLDIDNFKGVNETVGFARADQFLTDLASDVRSITLRGSYISRAHADQFASFAVIKDTVDPEAHVLQFQRTFSRRAELSCLDVTCSIGVAMYPTDGTSAKALMVAATKALEIAKIKRNSIQFHDRELSEKAMHRRQLITDLREAILNEQLSIVYQPKYNISTQAVSGLEVLVRWHHPQRGMISPEVFIPLAEDNGFIGDISKLVVAKASAELGSANILGSVVKHVSINVSATEFNHVDQMQSLVHFIRHHQTLLPFIRIEITETATLSDMSKSTHIISALRAEGFTFSIDDFGTGFTSLAMLKDLTVDEIKIDRSFITELERDERARTIVSAVIAMAQNFQINTVAEGIETQQQLDMLRSIGCDEAQGFYLGKPMRLDTLLTHLEGHQLAELDV